MTDTKTIVLAGNEIAVPALPLRLNMVAYPLCRKLTSNGLLDRMVASQGRSDCIDCSSGELSDLVELAYCGAKAADPSLERELFDDWAVSPSELLDAFLQIRYQTGAWVPLPAGEGHDAPGEAKGAKKPRK